MNQKYFNRLFQWAKSNRDKSRSIFPYSFFSHFFLSYSTLLSDCILWRPWWILYHCTIILWFLLISASMGFASFSFIFNPCFGFLFGLSCLGCIWPWILTSGDGPVMSSFSCCFCLMPLPSPQLLLFFRCCSSVLTLLYTLPEGSVVHFSSSLDHLAQ